MNTKKNIDRLFQEKFKDFEAAPSDAVWGRINESLPKKKKKRRVVALWWQIGGVAAVLALLLTVGVSVFNADYNSSNDLPIVNTEDSSQKNSDKNNTPITSPEDKQNEISNLKTYPLELVNSYKSEESLGDNKKEETPQKNNSSKQLTSTNTSSHTNAIVNTSYKKDKTTTPQKRYNLTTIKDKDKPTNVVGNTKTNNSVLENSKNDTLAADAELKSAIKKTIEDNKTAVVDNKKSNNTDTETSDTKSADTKNTDGTDINVTVIEDLKKQSIESAITENIKNINEKENKESRWSIKPNVAPVYFSSLGQGSSIDDQFNENSKSSDINMSYGIASTYAISKKLKIRAGVNHLNLNQKTSDVFAFTSGEFAARGALSHMGNINTRDGLHNVALMSSSMFNRSSTPEIFNTKITGDIEQRFGFIEVPLELEYRILDKKFGINVIGGFSTFFLNANEVYADVNGTSTLIGKANNINSTSFSANFGLGLDYTLSKQWNINLEPQFKYQLNTFNNTSGDFRPFIVGVYTGLNFKF